MPNARRRPRPTSRIERRLILTARSGDTTAQTRILTQYEPMMRLIARRLYAPGGSDEDLAQEARIGLLEAVRTWDAYSGVPFSNFAWMCSTREARNAVETARRHKHHVLTSATPLEIAEGTPLKTGEIAFACEAFAARRDRVCTPTRACVHSGDTDPVSKTLAREQLQHLIARTRTLSSLERRALMLANNDRTHREIAATLHIGVRTVNNALQRARHKLRGPIAA
jgi:RNA polymerase sporulation-specific sigma factor